MPSLNDQPNEIAGNRPSLPADETTKMGADAQNTNANSSLQPATPAMQSGEPAPSPPPSSKELFDSEMEAGKGAVEHGGEQENREANPADVKPQPTGTEQPLNKLTGTAPVRAAAQPGSEPAATTSSKSLANSETSVRKGAVEPGGKQENRPAPPTGIANSTQPNTYGGNFGNDVQGSFQDADRAGNQQANANRGEFGEQGTLGATHGGFGNQYREFDTAAERPSAEATEEKYYGQGASEPGLQHNAYRTYDGRDQRPEEQGHAVRDTPAPHQLSFGDNVADRQTDGRGNTQDNRNLPSKSGEAAAFQNDNGAPTVGPAYAADYGHTSGVGLPSGTPSHHLAMGPNGHGEVEDQRSSRGGYDNQGSQGGRSRDQQPGGNAPGGQQAPAPVDAPNAPISEGYGYGHERSEQAQPGNPNTGDSRNGFGASGSKEGNSSQGYGSKGGSYDDQNPGARGPEYDNFTKQDKAQNYGQENRLDFRPEDGDKPVDGDYGPEPRRNAGRDEPAQ
ncbi:hypothetical protein GCM10023172_39810 [Hymenobacter ginsengisoli]|uniref:Translation initiation factor IF-2 n=1 Tax=Hymenobacter ginsengisoli TaxID=1051626 RepID=A0ABP8QPN0_9BACT|nr:MULTISPECIES: hypothetical protein [unclassified Hymenobacter]MBO2032885.1 hypothetical protein [Hymenobacter sp. BT559]